MPACSNSWSFLSKPYPICCWFYYYASRSKLGFSIEVGSMENYEKRIALLKEFGKKEFKFRSKALTTETKFTRLHSTWINIEDPDDQDLLKKKMDELWKKSKAQLDLSSEIIESFNW